MIVLDVNLLLYAHMSASPSHAAARKWFEETLSSTTDVGIPLQSAMAFLRITTNQSIPLGRLEMGRALEIVERWLGQPNVRLLYPEEGHWPIFRKMLLEGRASGVLSTDAHLAAITIEYGGTLYTTDADFARFPGLRWKNPLATAR
ncbi:MAG: PIN domain-containing protein [Acidobacteria bacterium]|nr:PIN domain-containing protein [Acidobacteriota bacterium]